MSRIKLFPIVFVIALVACAGTGPKTEYRWRNASVDASWDKDSFECEGLAARTYPAANVREKIGNDNTSTTCFGTEGYLSCESSRSPFSFEMTSDSNEEGRNEYYKKCLRMKGWELLNATQSKIPHSDNNNSFLFGNNLTPDQHQRISALYPEWPELRKKPKFLFFLMFGAYTKEEIKSPDVETISKLLRSFNTYNRWVESSMEQLHSPTHQDILKEVLETSSSTVLSKLAATMMVHEFNRRRGSIPANEIPPSTAMILLDMMVLKKDYGNALPNQDVKVAIKNSIEIITAVFHKAPLVKGRPKAPIPLP